MAKGIDNFFSAFPRKEAAKKEFPDIQDRYVNRLIQSVEANREKNHMPLSEAIEKAFNFSPWDEGMYDRNGSKYAYEEFLKKDYYAVELEAERLDALNQHKKAA